MGSPVESDLEYLYQYAKGCKFIIETGGGGKSTHILGKAAREAGARMITIEADKDRNQVVDGVESMTGWSIEYDDIIKPGDPRFMESRYKKVIDRKVAHCRFKWLAHLLYMRGERDLIRKALRQNKDVPLDFFFCDTGEYCGLAEWDIVKNEIAPGGYFAAHDIYYPKSIKCFKVVEEIEKDDNWKVLVKTDNKKGLLIAQKQEK